MRKLWRAAVVGAAAMIMSAAFSFSSFAIVESINIRLEGSQPKAGSMQYIDAYTNDEYCYVSSCEYLNNSGYWNAGDVPSVLIEVGNTLGEDFHLTKSSVKVSGMSGAKVANVKNSGDESIIHVELKKISSSSSGSSSKKSDYDLDIDEAWWSNHTAKWERADDASKYEVQLRRDGNTVETVTTTSSSYNFGSKISRSGYYTFRVRAIHGSNKGSWEESGRSYFEHGSSSSSSSSTIVPAGGSGSGPAGGGPAGGGGNSSPAAVSAGWQKDHIGWWWRNPDGSWPANDWMFINNKWYFFGPDGYMRTGWIEWKGQYYYCDMTNGDMLVNTVTPDGFRVDGNGAWIR